MNKFLKHRKITVSEMAPHVHSFLPNENKVNKISKWLMSWIDSALSVGKICPNDLLPSKSELAYHIGVSEGTFQNVFRFLEDSGYVESKQRIGTYIIDRRNEYKTEKLTSKRELVIELVKKYIKEHDIKLGQVVDSIRLIAKTIGVPITTVRQAMFYMENQGLVKKSGKNYVLVKNDYNLKTIETKTLVEKIAENIKIYINNKLSAGDKLPSNQILAKMFNVSTKTIHDSIKILTKQGIVYTRRGKYGTIVSGNNENNEDCRYFYEKMEQRIKSYIISNCAVGDKLPSVKEFSQMYDISEKTIKKALDNMFEDGFVTFARGRYGGTFVTDIPQKSAEAYQWLAINSEYIIDTEN